MTRSSSLRWTACLRAWARSLVVFNSSTDTRRPRSARRSMVRLLTFPKSVYEFHAGEPALESQRPVQLCHMPSSNTARFAALSRPLAVIMTSVAVAPPRCASGRSCSPASIFAAQGVAPAAISACSASVLRRSRRPLASARSSSAARRFASAEPAAPFAILLAGCAGTRFAAGCAGIAARRAVLAALGEDINLIPFLDHFVFAQLEPAVGHALAGLHVVFVAVPRAHEVHFAVGEV